jgi:hypothetical protein
VYATFLALQVFAVIFGFIFLRHGKQIVRDDGTHLAVFEEKVSVKVELAETFKMLGDWRLALLIPVMFSFVSGSRALQGLRLAQLRTSALDSVHQRVRVQPSRQILERPSLLVCPNPPGLPSCPNPGQHSLPPPYSRTHGSCCPFAPRLRRVGWTGGLDGRQEPGPEPAWTKHRLGRKPGIRRLVRSTRIIFSF